MLSQHLSSNKPPHARQWWRLFHIEKTDRHEGHSVAAWSGCHAGLAVSTRVPLFVGVFANSNVVSECFRGLYSEVLWKLSRLGLLPALLLFGV